MADLRRTVTVPELPVRAGLRLETAWWGVAAVFLVHGLVVSTWVSRIASIKGSHRMGDAALGLALLGAAIGSLIAIPLCGWAVATYGAKRTVQWTACGFAASLLPLALAPDVAWLCAALFFYGAMAGANDVAINAQAVAAEKRLGSSTMSRFHAMFSLGGLAGAGIGAVVANHGIQPLFHFVAASVAISGVIAGAAVLLDEYPSTATQSSPLQLQAPPLPLLILSAVGFCFFLSEGAIADWTGVYIAQVLGAGEAYAAAGYAVFSAAMTLFRFTGDSIADRMGRATTIRAGAVLAAGGLVTAVLASSPVAALAGFAAVGAGFSSIIPLVFASAGRVSSVPESAGVATVSGVGYMGFLVGPPAIGFVSEWLSLRAGLLLLAMLSLAGAILVTVLARSGGGVSALRPDDSTE